MGFRSQPKIDFKSNDKPRILICRFRHLGDVIVSTPLIQQIRKSYPDAHIAYLTEEKFAPILERNPYLNQIIPATLHRNPFESHRAAFRRQIALIASLRAGEFDLIIDLFGSFRSALYAFLSGAEFRVGGNPKAERMFYTHFQNHKAPQESIVERYLNSLKFMGIKIKTQPPEIFITKDERNSAYHYLRSKGLDPEQPIIGLHPGATWPTKIWDYTNYSQLAQKLSQAGLQVYVTCRPGEENITKKIAGGWIGPVIIGDILPVRELAAVIKHFFIHVANDCGVMHLSASIGTPTFGIFGPGEPHVWFPYALKDGHKAFWQEMDCRPCFTKECSKGNGACLKAIDHNDVLDEIIRQVKKHKQSDSSQLLGED
ncbi:MAG: glycosyltransferase family 9 protein [Calditrichaeota bacterium]|nr:MAG: glycosyltransferase family 9 protein [Calditrichota bacterium]